MLIGSFLLHKFSSALMTNPYSNLPTMCNLITRTSLVPRDHPFSTCTCPPLIDLSLNLTMFRVYVLLGLFLTFQAPHKPSTITYE
jgi:hypothetical protein